ncbi:MAG: Wzz/FepE/Etk N-terminal domain-containing protein [Pseudomonadota bacterium]
MINIDTTQSRSTYGSIHVRVLLAPVFRYKILILCIAVAFSFLGIILAISIQPTYRSTIVALPVGANSGPLAGVSSTLGGAAALAGVDLSGPTTTTEFVAILKSKQMIDRFVKEHGALPVLFPKNWDENTQAWKKFKPSGLGGLLFGISRWIASFSGDEGWSSPENLRPKADDIYQVFGKIRTIEEDKKTGIISLSFTLPRPELAANWSNSFLAMVNEEIRRRAVFEAETSLNYLSEKVIEVNVQSVKRSVFNAIETQLKNAMLANARKEFAFQILDPAKTPARRTHPNRALIVIGFGFIGIVFGIIVAFTYDAFREKKGIFAPIKQDRPTLSIY